MWRWESERSRWRLGSEGLRWGSKGLRWGSNYLSAFKHELLLRISSDGGGKRRREDRHHHDAAEHPHQTEQASRDRLGRAVAVPDNT